MAKEISREVITNKRKHMIYLAITIVAIVGIIFFAFRVLGSGNTNTDYRDRFRQYNDGWTVIIDGERETKDLPTELKSGEDGLIVLKKNLPATIPRYSAIAVRNYHMAMEVLVNGEVIYEYPDRANDRATIISDAWNIINISPQSYRGTLEIRLTNVSLTPFKGTISDIYFGDDNSLIQHIRSISMWGFLSGVILMIFGAFLVGVSLIYRRFSYHQPNVAMGFVLFCFGVWLANRSKMPFFSSSNGRVFFISLVALIMVAPLIFLYSYYRNDIGKRISMIGFKVSMAAGILIILLYTFVRFNAQTIAILAYFASFAAILNQGRLLYISSFGEDSKLRSKRELFLDRTEFFSTALFPIGGALEMIFYSHELWTEISNAYRIVILLFALMYLITIIWRIYIVVQDRTMVVDRLQESQLELMMGQIQPHFIFNTLSSIRTLVKIDPDVAYKMLYDFSVYLRANVDNVTNLDGIKFAAEVEHIRSYTNIEKVRFGDRLNIEFDIEVGDFKVPPLSIQPLVENAIKHGVCQKPEGGTVVLRSYEDENYNIVEVNDNGTGISRDAASALFSIYEENDDKLGMESNRVRVLALKNMMESMTLLDEDGSPLEYGGITKQTDLSGHGTTQHKSKGMMNIILRLKEISNAKIEIYSRVGEGTKIKVLFPKN